MNLQGKRAAIVTLGCKVNQYETDAMYGMLKEAGVTMAALFPCKFIRFLSC